MSANNDNVLSLRELCQKATKGPYSVTPSPIPGSTINDIVLDGDSNEMAEFFSDPDSILAAEANARLCARCSPETMLRVYEALKTGSHQTEQVFCGERATLFAHLCTELLELLDGKETP